MTKQGAHRLQRAVPGVGRSRRKARTWIVRCRAPRRPASALGARLGRHRRPRPGAARRARHPAEAPRLLHRRAEQDVERRCLQLHRAESPGALDDRGQRDLSRLVHRRQPGRRVGQHGVRHRRTSRAAARSGISSRPSSRARSRWATARRSAICCTARRTIRRSRDGAGSSSASGMAERRSSTV